jgi:hypothetical protein
LPFVVVVVVCAFSKVCAIPFVQLDFDGISSSAFYIYLFSFICFTLLLVQILLPKNYQIIIITHFVFGPERRNKKKT